MAGNHEREGKDVLEDGDNMYNPLLDDLDLETLMEDEDCHIGGAEEVPPTRRRRMWRLGRSHGPQGESVMVTVHDTNGPPLL